MKSKGVITCDYTNTIVGMLELVIKSEPLAFKSIPKLLEIRISEQLHKDLCLELGRNVKSYKGRKVRVMQGGSISYSHKDNFRYEK